MVSLIHNTHWVINLHYCTAFRIVSQNMLVQSILSGELKCSSETFIGQWQPYEYNRRQYVQGKVCSLLVREDHFTGAYPSTCGMDLTGTIATLFR